MTTKKRIIADEITERHLEADFVTSRNKSQKRYRKVVKNNFLKIVPLLQNEMIAYKKIACSHLKNIMHLIIQL